MWMCVLPENTGGLGAAGVDGAGVEMLQKLSLQTHGVGGFYKGAGAYSG